MCQSRDGGIGRRAGLRIQCPKGVQVQVLFPAPTLRSLDWARDFGSGLRRPLNASSSSPVPGTNTKLSQTRIHHCPCRGGCPHLPGGAKLRKTFGEPNSPTRTLRLRSGQAVNVRAYMFTVLLRHSVRSTYGSAHTIASTPHSPAPQPRFAADCGTLAVSSRRNPGRLQIDPASDRENAGCR